MKIRLKGKQLDAFTEAIKSGGDAHTAFQKTCEQVAAVGTVPKRFFLAQDGDSHWHLVEASKRKEWNAWVDSGDETTPTFAQMLGTGPQLVEFESPILL